MCVCTCIHIYGVNPFRHADEYNTSLQLICFCLLSRNATQFPRHMNTSYFIV